MLQELPGRSLLAQPLLCEPGSRGPAGCPTPSCKQPPRGLPHPPDTHRHKHPWPLGISPLLAPPAGGGVQSRRWAGATHRMPRLSSGNTARPHVQLQPLELQTPLGVLQALQDTKKRHPLTLCLEPALHAPQGGPHTQLAERSRHRQGLGPKCTLSSSADGRSWLYSLASPQCGSQPGASFDITSYSQLAEALGIRPDPQGH